jgi:hypothetical protein
MAIRFYAPLTDFVWNGNTSALTDDVTISDDVVLPNLGETAKQLSETEWERVNGARHWLTFELEEGSPTTPYEIANLVMLALWIANPTQTRFE